MSNAPGSIAVVTASLNAVHKATAALECQPRVTITKRRMWLPRRAADILAYLFLALLLTPALAHSFDLTLLTAEPSRWLQWHQNLFEYWKFGAPYALLDAGTFCMHFFLAALGLTPVVAQHVATKIPLIAAGLLDGVLLSKLAPSHLSRRVRSAWLLSPVVLWVAAGQPQVEPLSVACLLLALYFRDGVALHWRRTYYHGATLRRQRLWLLSDQTSSTSQ